MFITLTRGSPSEEPVGSVGITRVIANPDAVPMELEPFVHEAMAGFEVCIASNGRSASKGWLAKP